MHAPGARGTRPLTVAVTDETGRPVGGAAVSFHLPDEGPGGIFTNGLRTDVATTDEGGRASLRGWQLNRMAGRFQIRITASKEQATAGTVSFQYITDPGGRASAKTATAAPAGSHSHAKWLVIVGLVAGGAAAGVVAARPHSAGAASSNLSIGTPAISVGKP